MNISVNNRDLGFWTQTEITAQRFEVIDGEAELVWCNHAGAQEETVEHDIINIDGPDHVYYATILQCDKCPAYKREGDNYWEEAPIEGVHEDERY